MNRSFVLTSNSQPRHRRLTVARPFKAGKSELRSKPVASATVETGDRSFQPSLTRLEGFVDAASPALKGRAKFILPLTRRFRLFSERVSGRTWRRAITLIALLLTGAACERNAGLPKPDSKEYRELVTAFYVGLAGLQTGEDVRAKEKLTRATEIAPGEPAAWANLGLLAVRQQEFDTAYEKVEKARALAPDNSQIEALLGLIESKRGRLTEAATHLKRAVELDPKNLRALYALAQETER